MTTLAPPMPPTRRVLPRYDEGGAVPPSVAMTKGEPAKKLYDSGGRYWVWDGTRWQDVGPVGKNQSDYAAISAARSKADAILAGGGSAAPAAGATAPAKPAGTGNPIADLIIGKAKAYALANGGSQQDADAFARVAVAIASGESSLNPNAIRDTRTGNDPLIAAGKAQRELSVGLFQLNFMGGRGSASGLTPEQAKDPALNTDASMPDLWGAFKKNGAGAAFLADPVTTTARTYQQGQGSVAPSVQNQILPGLAVTGGGVSGVAPAQGGAAGSTATTNGATSTDPELNRMFQDVSQKLDTARQEYYTISSKPNPTNADQIRAVQLGQLIDTLEGQWVNLYKMVKPSAGESPLQQASARQSIFSSQQGLITDIYNQQRQLVMDAFGAKKSEADFMLSILNSAFTQSLQKWNTKVQQGEANMADAMKVIEAEATQQTAEAARALKGMELAQLINANDWKIAERALPAGSHYQPMFGPNDPLVKQMRDMGLGDASIQAAPIDTAKLDLRNTLKESPDLLTKLGYAPPSFSVQGVRDQAAANQDIPPFDGQPITPQNFAAVWPKAPDLSKLEGFLNTQLADIQNFNPYPQPVYQSPPGGEGGGNGAGAKPPVAPLNVRTDLTRPTTATDVVSGLRINPATNRIGPAPGSPANTTTANSFTSGNEQAAPGLVRAFDPKTNQYGFVKPQDANWDNERGSYFYNPGGNTQPVDAWEVDPATGQLRRRRAA